MTRWSRAERIIRKNVAPGAAVLDAGCAFGFGSKGLARDYRVFGIDANVAEVARTPQTFAGRVAGSLTALPFADATFDAFLCLEVLEHIPEPGRAVDELARVLRPGAIGVISVPNAGLFAMLDSYNVCSRFFEPGEVVPPGQRHHHFDAEELDALLDPGFQVLRRRYSGTGLSEPFHYPIVAATRWTASLRPIYDRLRFIYYSLALADDEIPTGSWGYNQFVVVRRRRP